MNEQKEEFEKQPYDNPEDALKSPGIVYGKLMEDDPTETGNLVSSIVIPKEKDFEKGFYKRFFIARYDSTDAVEVTEDFYKKKYKKLAKGIYSKVELRWYLRDNLNFERKKMLVAITAYNMNEDNVTVASKDMPQLKNTLKDFDQFVG